MKRIRTIAAVATLVLVLAIVAPPATAAPLDAGKPLVSSQAFEVLLDGLWSSLDAIFDRAGSSMDPNGEEAESETTTPDPALPSEPASQDTSQMDPNG